MGQETKILVGLLVVVSFFIALYYKYLKLPLGRL